MENLNYENAMARLDQIAELLEENKETLDEALALYEEGIALIRFCQKTLDEAETRVKKLTVDGNGELTEVDFKPSRG